MEAVARPAGDDDPAFALELEHRDGSCPIQDALAMIADKWKLLILLELNRSGMLRFKELQRALAPVSQKVLTAALRELEADDLVARTVYAEVPPRVEYRPTASARSLLPALRHLNDWAVAKAQAGAVSPPSRPSDGRPAAHRSSAAVPAP